MGIHLIKMPDIGEGIAEVELVEWHVQPGDDVVEDQVLADVMTDKATVEVPSPVNGKVQWLGGKVGDVMAVGADLIRIEVEGEGNVRDGGAAAGAGQSAAAQAASSGSAAAASAPMTTSTAGHGNPTGVATAASGAAGSASGGAGSAASGVSASGLSAAAQAGAAATASTGGQPSAGLSYADERLAADTAESGRMPGAGAAVGHAQAAGAPGAGAAFHGRAPGEKPVASPAVRRQAWDMGIDLRYVRGTGPQGRILREDLQAFAASAHAASASGDASVAAQAAAGHVVGGGAYAGGVGGNAFAGGASPGWPSADGAAQDARTEIPVVGLRRRIAQKMQESKRSIPHFSYVEEVDITELEALRGQLNAQWGASHGKLTLLPLLARAMVLALRDFPHINARYDDQAQVVTQFQAVHLGVAAQTDAGLMVPVLRHAEAMDLWRCATEITRLAQAARSGKAARDELSGSTITLTSLGALGGIVSTPVINHPEVAIVGVNRMVEKPVVRDGAIVVRKTMNLSSSFDHRVVDGMHAAQFIQAIRRLLECPALLFVTPFVPAQASIQASVSPSAPASASVATPASAPNQSTRRGAE